MRCGWMGILVLVLAAGVDAQITRTATFENFIPEFLNSSFTDPSSGIFFYNSTAPFSYFSVASQSSPFGTGNYLTGGSNGGWAADFGFSANLPQAADTISIEVSFIGTPPGSSGIVLEGFSNSNASGSLVSQQSIPDASNPFTLSITSGQYNISSFEINVTGVSTNYDNISYTYLPEPSMATIFFGIAVSTRRRK